jgi:hypothetical protein
MIVGKIILANVQRFSISAALVATALSAQAQETASLKYNFSFNPAALIKTGADTPVPSPVTPTDKMAYLAATVEVCATQMPQNQANDLLAKHARLLNLAPIPANEMARYNGFKQKISSVLTEKIARGAIDANSKRAMANICDTHVAQSVDAMLKIASGTTNSTTSVPASTQSATAANASGASAKPVGVGLEKIINAPISKGYGPLSSVEMGLVAAAVLSCSDKMTKREADQLTDSYGIYLKTQRGMRGSQVDFAKIKSSEDIIYDTLHAFVKTSNWDTYRSACSEIGSALQSNDASLRKSMGVWQKAIPIATPTNDIKASKPDALAL